MKILSSQMIYLFLLTSFPATSGRFYQRHFGLESFGVLTEDSEILFSDEGTTFASTINNCAKFCSGDRRCIGIELCTIKTSLHRCRVCCGWQRIRSKTNLTVDSHQCKYLKMVDDRLSNVAVNKPATMISAFNPVYHLASKAVDDVTVCPTGLDTAHTGAEFMPWLKIDLLDTVDVTKVLIFNRQDYYDMDSSFLFAFLQKTLGDTELADKNVAIQRERLHDLLITVSGNGAIHKCGFFQGPATSADRIIVFCPSGSTGNDVTFTIQSRKGETDILHVCEVQIFVATS